MTSRPYTEDDLRAEAARQFSEFVADVEEPHNGEVGVQMVNAPIASRAAWTADAWWHCLRPGDFKDAEQAITDLIDEAVNVSRWAVDLGACALTQTTELAWGHATNWDLAIQVAHRRGLDDELHTALTTAVRDAANNVLQERGISSPVVEKNATAEGAGR